MKKYKNGLVIMRAQPLHIFHIELIKFMLDECEKGTVAIGSIQENRTMLNPFTLEERKQMICNVFKEEIDSGVLKVMGIEDIGNDSKWVSFVLSRLDFVPDAYFAGSESDGRFFAEKNFKVEIFDRNFAERAEVSGTEIRKKLREGKFEEVKKFIPKENIGFVNNFFENEDRY